MTSVGIRDYLFSLIFWLDIMCTFAIITDLVSVRQGLMGYQNEDETTMMYDTADFIDTNSRVGMILYAAKVTRIIRVIRLIRIFRLYTEANQEVEN
jgi:hypothetical protein